MYQHSVSSLKQFYSNQSDNNKELAHNSTDIHPRNGATTKQNRTTKAKLLFVSYNIPLTHGVHEPDKTILVTTWRIIYKLPQT